MEFVGQLSFHVCSVFFLFIKSFQLFCPSVTTEHLLCARFCSVCWGYHCEKMGRILAFQDLLIQCGEKVSEHIITKLTFGTDEG